MNDYLILFLFIPALEACLPQLLVPIPKIPNPFEGPPKSKPPSKMQPPIFQTPYKTTPATTTLSFLQKINKQALEKQKETNAIVKEIDKTSDEQLK